MEAGEPQGLVKSAAETWRRVFRERRRDPGAAWLDCSRRTANRSSSRKSGRRRVAVEMHNSTGMARYETCAAAGGEMQSGFFGGLGLNLEKKSLAGCGNRLVQAIAN